VTRLGKQKLILGYSWLRKHNPEIDWETREVKMSWCPLGCATCTTETRTKRRHAKTATRILQHLRAGPFLAICAIDTEDRLEDDGDDDDLGDFDDGDDDPLEEGDRILYTRFSASEDLRATSTVSQRLAEAHSRNSAAGKDELPDWMRDFEDVFNRTQFDSLLECRVWDHAIELVPDSKPANCKVYPISPLEQRELDAFIEEALGTGQIRPSKSPMASPVFFVK